MLESIPPALVPVVVAVVAAVIGGLLWRLFKLALKLVMLVVFVVIVAGLVVWKNPALVGIVREQASDALTEQTSSTKTPTKTAPKLEKPAHGP